MEPFACVAECATVGVAESSFTGELFISIICYRHVLTILAHAEPTGQVR